MRVSVVAPGITIATVSTSANADIPKNAAGKYPAHVRLAATAACYARLGYGGGATGTAVLGAVSATVDDVGSGYAVGDEITLTGGTNTAAVVLRVTGETAGAVDTVEVVTAGLYTVIPGNSVAQGSSTGGGTGASFVVVWGVQAVTITGAGLGYQVGTAVTFSGGGGSAAAAQVSTVSDAGAVTGIAITNPGTGYTSLPTVAIGVTTTAAAGDLLIQPGDSLVLNTAGATRVAGIRVAADGVLQVSPVEDVFR